MLVEPPVLGMVKGADAPHGVPASGLLLRTNVQAPAGMLPKVRTTETLPPLELELVPKLTEPEVLSLTLTELEETLTLKEPVVRTVSAPPGPVIQKVPENVLKPLGNLRVTFTEPVTESTVMSPAGA
jgi:hypothetical protein